MKKRYILLIFTVLLLLYILWCNISIIYTRNPTSKIPLIDNISYQKDTFFSGNATVLWQGFYHDWSYNHRLNRLGDWMQDIKSNDGKFQASFNHSAASGSGSDILNYLTYFTYLRTTKARFLSSTVSTVVRGREATTTTKIITVKGVLPPELRNYKHAVVVLNGFDLYCRSSDDGQVMGTSNADKLSQLFLEVDKLKFTGDEFEFDLAIKLGADCDSPECLNLSPGDNEWFDYQLTTAYQLIAFNDDARSTNSSLQQYYSWRKPFKTRPDMDPNEIFRNNFTLINKTIKGAAGFNIGIPVINKIDINLPKGKGGLLRKRLETPHLLSLDIAITDYTYNSSTGICTYNADLFFKNWKPDMHPLSYGNDGKAYINLGLRLLQVNDPAAIVEIQSIKGKINWETSQLDQRQANDANSVKSFIFVR